MIDLKSSYSSADAIPPKLLLNDGVSQLRPIHVQWMPTNQCNLNCKFCSCSERDQNQEEMDFIKAQAVIQELAGLGCRAVTITGGGEPLCYSYFLKMVQCFHENRISVGLVTNGTLLNQLDQDTLSLITWCRISSSDDRSLTSKYQGLLESAIEKGVRVDWAFSHVVTSTPNYREIRSLVNFANDYKFTHVRLVADVLNPEDTNLDRVRRYLSGIDHRVIYQPRSTPVKSASCAIGYIKPVIDVDFKMYLCCGVQYALETPSRSMPPQLCMGSAFNLEEIYQEDKKLFYVNCERCYYEQYNVALRPLIQGINHKEFL